MDNTLKTIAAALNSIKQDVNILAKTMWAMTAALCSSNLMAARIQSAKTEYERNEAIKEGNRILEMMKKSPEEPCQTEKTN
jgi:hypothetical protein